MRSLPPSIPLGVFLLIIGAAVAFAPDILIATPSHELLFSVVPQEVIGGAQSLMGALMIIGAARRSPNTIRLAAVIELAAALTWATTSMVPLFQGNQANILSMGVWLYVAADCFATAKDPRTI